MTADIRRLRIREVESDVREAEQIVSMQGAAECLPCGCQTMLGRQMRAQHGSSCSFAAACMSALLSLLHPCTNHPDSGSMQESTLSGLSR